jgi:hypothetical protein
MKRVYVDFNSREDGNPDTVLVRPLSALAATRGEAPMDFVENELVILETEDIECFGRLRKISCDPGWVADILPGTTVDLPEAYWTRFRS